MLDAYQADVISLDELTERRGQIVTQRRALDRQLEQQRALRGERVKAQEVVTDLTAFCGRIRGRSADASFADKQAILQLIIERIIVHDDSLEIRHVIPLHDPLLGREPVPTAGANGGLRSDGVHPAPLPRRLEDAGDRRLDAAMGVGDHQLDAAQPPAFQLAAENSIQKVSASDGPMSMPRTSRRPSVLTATAMVTATETMRPFWRTFT